MQQFCTNFLCTTGLNNIEIEIERDSSDNVQKFNLLQTCTNIKFPTLRSFHVNLKVFYNDDTSEVLKVMVQDKHTTPVNEVLNKRVKGYIFNYQDEVYVEYSPKKDDIEFFIDNQHLLAEDELDIKNMDNLVILAVKDCKIKTETALN